jgi:small subunit ribosomal protein S1
MSSEPDTEATPPAAPEPSDAPAVSHGDSSHDAEEQAVAPSADAAPSDDAGESGDAGDDDGGDEASGDEGTGGANGDADSGTAGAAGTKPKRKRRRKKKPAGAQGPQQGAQAQQGQGGPRPGPKKQRHRASDRAPFHVGEEVFGKVTAVLDAAVMVDLAGKALAIFDRSEMEADDLVPSTGDRFVARVHVDGLRGGLVVLTRKPLREEETKPKLEQAHKEGALVSGLVTGVIKGGVEVDIGGLRAFAPASGLDLHPANANFTSLVGTRLDFKVAQYEKAGRDVVVTRRPMLEAEAHERRKHALALLTEGQVMTGVVRTVVEWGVFVALPEAENVEGLIHVSEASHDPHPDLLDLFRHGEKVEVKILGIDERGKIWLSRKALVEDPWGQARAKYANGTRHTGKVLRREVQGVFVPAQAELRQADRPAHRLRECLVPLPRRQPPAHRRRGRTPVPACPVFCDRHRGQVREPAQQSVVEVGRRTERGDAPG